MTTKLITSFVFALTVCQISSAQQLIGYYPEGGGKMSIETTEGPILTGGIVFQAVEGILTQGDDPAPFEFFLPSVATPGNVTFGTLGGLIIDGVVELDMTVSSLATATDINAYWGDGTVPTPFTINGFPSDPFNSDTPPLVGNFDYDGGPITIRAVNGPILTDGLNLRAVSGSLTGGGSAAPFDTVSENTANRWSVNSDDFVIIDGDVELDVVASADADILGDFSIGDTKPFTLTRRDPERLRNLVARFPFEGGPVTIESINEPVVTRQLDFTATRGTLSSDGSPVPFESLANNTTNQWTARSNTDVIIDGLVELDLTTSHNAQLEGLTFDGTTTRRLDVRPGSPVNESSLVGRFPEGGGNITITTTNGPLEVGFLEFLGDQSELRQGASPAPFAFFVPSGPGTIVFGVLGTPLILDGSVELDVFAFGGATIEANWRNGPTLTQFPVTEGEIPTIDSFEIIGVYPPEGGPLTLIFPDGPVDLSGVEFVADPDVLTQGASAEPFSFFIPNAAAPGNVTFGVLGTPVSLSDSIELDLTVSAGTPEGAILANWVNGSTPISFRVVPSNQLIPEPSSHVIVAIGLCGLLTLRRKRRVRERAALTGLSASFPFDGGPVTSKAGSHYDD